MAWEWFCYVRSENSNIKNARYAGRLTMEKSWAMKYLSNNSIAKKYNIYHQTLFFLNWNIWKKLTTKRGSTFDARKNYSIVLPFAKLYRKQYQTVAKAIHYGWWEIDSTQQYNVICSGTDWQYDRRLHVFGRMTQLTTINLLPTRLQQTIKTIDQN